jgi:hypothetical protein
LASASRDIGPAAERGATACVNDHVDFFVLAIDVMRAKIGESWYGRQQRISASTL